jgi:hypothetical protein
VLGASDERTDDSPDRDELAAFLAHLSVPRCLGSLGLDGFWWAATPIERMKL